MSEEEFEDKKTEELDAEKIDETVVEADEPETDTPVSKKSKKEELSSEDEYMALLKEDEQKKEARGEDELSTEDEEKISVIKIDKKDKKKGKKKEEEEVPQTEESLEPKIYALRTTANREDQVMSFVTSNAARKKLHVYSVIRPHGMRGYIFMEAGSRGDAEQAAFGVPYARGLLPSIIQYKEIEHMLEQVKKEMNIQKNDIAEIISGPFKREKCKITRVDKAKEEVVVELLEAAVPIPLTLKIDAVKVIRREGEPATDDEK
jgi:transcription termination/antitermination protein NusG